MRFRGASRQQNASGDTGWWWWWHLGSPSHTPCLEDFPIWLFIHIVPYSTFDNE